MPADKPLKFKLMIESFNDGMRTLEDVAYVLESAAERLREMACTPELLTATLRDINGNAVGHLELRNAVDAGVDDV